MTPWWPWRPVGYLSRHPHPALRFVWTRSAGQGTQRLESALIIMVYSLDREPLFQPRKGFFYLADICPHARAVLPWAC